MLRVLSVSLVVSTALHGAENIFEVPLTDIGLEEFRSQMDLAGPGVAQGQSANQAQPQCQRIRLCREF
jgi:hypothetical protein